jgi:hypothetical protein
VLCHTDIASPGFFTDYFSGSDRQGFFPTASATFYALCAYGEA